MSSDVALRVLRVELGAELQKNFFGIRPKRASNGVVLVSYLLFLCVFVEKIIECC